MRALFVTMAAALLLADCIPPVMPSDDAAAAALTSFGFITPSTVGVVDQQCHSVRVCVPWGTDCRSLVATFSTTGQRVTVDGIEQESGISSNDFSWPVEYVVESPDGSPTPYRVAVIAAARPGQQKTITQFGFAQPPVVGAVDEILHVISAAVPRGTDRSSLVAQFVTTGTTVSVAETEQHSGVTVNDFTEPVTYRVTAEDGSTQAYLVTVGEAPCQENAIAAFRVQAPEAATSIDEEHKVIRVRVGEGTDLSCLVAEFVTSGVAVRVGGIAQESGITENDFTSQVEYQVDAEDGSSCRYLVRVTSHLPLVVNEIDVDQVGTDSAEFVELCATAEIDLGGIVVLLINGGVTPGLEYARVDLSPAGVLGPGSYLVIAGPSVPVAPQARRLTPAGWELTNRIQNGPADAVVIWDTVGRRIVDAVTYGGVQHRALISGDTAEWDVTEGSTGAPSDSNSMVGSIARSPDGQDTGHNDSDFRLCPTLTPGGPNP